MYRAFVGNTLNDAEESSFGATASRRLLSHCFDDVEHVSSGTSHTNSDAKRIIAWFVNLLFAVALIVYAVVKWPPPRRVFPRRKPIASIPWCVTARLVGYGVFDWRTGKLTPWWDYIKEKHDVLNIFAGDAGFITQRGRFVHLVTELTCTVAVSMVLTDLTTTRVTGDFWTRQIWVFVMLLTYDIVLGIGLRLLTVGVTHASFQEAERVGFECAEKGEIDNLEDEEQLFQMARKASQAFNYQQHRMVRTCTLFAFTSVLVGALWAHLANPSDGCGNAFNTFLAYAYMYGLYQGFSLLLIVPVSLSVRWAFSAFLLTRIDEVESAEDTMDCCWRRRFPKYCSCLPPLVTPLEQKTIENWLASPRKEQKITTGNLVHAAAAAGKVRYNAPDSPLTPMTPKPPMTKDTTAEDDDNRQITPRQVVYDTESDVADSPTPECRTESLSEPVTPEQKYSSLKRAASMRYGLPEDTIDDGIIENRPIVRVNTPESDADNMAQSASLAAARMALMAAGKLTPEQVVQTRRSFGSVAPIARYADVDSESSGSFEFATERVDDDDDDVEMARVESFSSPKNEK